MEHRLRVGGNTLSHHDSGLLMLGEIVKVIVGSSRDIKKLLCRILKRGCVAAS